MGIIKNRTTVDGELIKNIVASSALNECKQKENFFELNREKEKEKVR